MTVISYTLGVAGILAWGIYIQIKIIKNSISIFCLISYSEKVNLTYKKMFTRNFHFRHFCMHFPFCRHLRCHLRTNNLLVKCPMDKQIVQNNLTILFLSLYQFCLYHFLYITCFYHFSSVIWQPKSNFGALQGGSLTHEALQEVGPQSLVKCITGIQIRSLPTLS